MIDVHPADAGRFADLDELFAGDDTADRCWCMWFIVPYREFHPAGRNGNRAAFVERTERDPNPMGLIAYDDHTPVGWCAVGPRARYARAVKGPTLERRTGDDDSIWFVPCLFVHPDHRRRGIAAALLDAACTHAAAAGAEAIEGFPIAGDTRRSSGSDLMTGNERLFRGAGFESYERPSAARVLVRRRFDDDAAPATEQP